MPELPEVQTTVTGLTRTIVGLTIIDVWTDYNSPYFKGSGTIKDPAYFKHFKKEILNKKIVGASRRAKNVLIHLEQDGKGKIGSTILIHMKMTGHIMIGKYIFDSHNNKKTKTGNWSPAPDERKALHDPYNKYIHFVITLSNGQQLVLSDTRKFAKVTLIDSEKSHSEHLKDLGPEPLDKSFILEVFKDRLNKKPTGKIKTVLMDQTVISGVGNIYSDEALWRSSIHPEQKVQDIPNDSLKSLYEATKQVLRKGIDFGGDSMSDYRNVDGERGKFQEHHQVYRRKGQPCTFKVGSGKSAKTCPGIIQRIIVGGRSTHFCPVHQKLHK
jgi:formamidopyrimidine-DNA glycosylase